MDYIEIFPLVVMRTSFRMLLSIMVSDDLELDQLDIKTNFLHGKLHELIYMDQTKGFEVPGKENVCLRKMSLYGPK